MWEQIEVFGKLAEGCVNERKTARYPRGDGVPEFRWGDHEPTIKCEASPSIKDGVQNNQSAVL